MLKMSLIIDYRDQIIEFDIVKNLYNIRYMILIYIANIYIYYTQRIFQQIKDADIAYEKEIALSTFFNLCIRRS